MSRVERDAKCSRRTQSDQINHRYCKSGIVKEGTDQLIPTISTLINQLITLPPLKRTSAVRVHGYGLGPSRSKANELPRALSDVLSGGEVLPRVAPSLRRLRGAPPERGVYVFLILHVHHSRDQAFALSMYVTRTLSRVISCFVLPGEVLFRHCEASKGGVSLCKDGRLTR